MQHVALLGDSIFDNATYVQEGGAVIDHLRRDYPDLGSTLLAVDGAVCDGVFAQLEKITPDVTHLALSVGGNNALVTGPLLFMDRVNNVGDAIVRCAEVLRPFAQSYHELIRAIVAKGLPLAVCTIYDHIPDLSIRERTGLQLFNDIITRTALEAGADIIDLRLLCNQPHHYSEASSIEPSDEGARVIAKAIAARVTGCNKYPNRRTVFF